MDSLHSVPERAGEQRAPLPACHGVESEPSPTKKKPPPKVTKLEAKTKAKATSAPTTYEEVSQAVVDVLKKAGVKVTSMAIHEGLSPKAPSQGKKLFERHRQHLLDDAVIVKEGNGRGMTYGLPE